MNRREFIIKFCMLISSFSIGGKILNYFISNKNKKEISEILETDQTKNLLSGTTSTKFSVYDYKQAKEYFTHLEKIGFIPKEAMFWEKVSSNKVRCLLCPKYCTLRTYERGNCKVRFGLDNKLVTIVYGKPCSIGIDPIEKKPVFHYLPGTLSYSIATAGCVFSCKYCQNWQISQALPEELDFYDLPPQKVVEEAIKTGCKTISYTYTEPTIFYEYVYDTAKIAKENGLGNIVISCGYINKEPLLALAPYLDVMKVDLKGFTDKFYRTICGGGLQPVLDTILTLSKTNVLLDIVTLIVPTLNDDENTNIEMFKWLLTNIGNNFSLFLSRFYPTYKLKNLPPTPISVLERLRNKALEIGLKYVYLGNAFGHEAENTFCPNCKKIIVKRIGYSVLELNITNENKCKFCNYSIPGKWY